MRPIVAVYVALSLDGFIAEEDGGLGFLDAMQVEGEDYGYAAFAAGVDTVVMGRGTFDVCTGFAEWPYPEHDVCVVTHRGLETVPPRVSSYAGPLGPLFATLAVGGKRRVYLDGGQLISQALADDLVDELTLSWVPVVLGRGRRLFHAPLATTKWQFEDLQRYATGLVQVRYARTP